MLSNKLKNIEDYRLHQRIGYKLSKLTRLMQHKMEEGLDNHGITRMQWMALTAIEIEHKSSPSDLAEHIGVSRPAISRLLKQLESAELIERRLIGDDGRTRQLSVTDEGREKIAICWPHVHETEQYFLRKLDDAESQAMCAIVQTLLFGETETLDKI